MSTGAYDEALLADEARLFRELERIADQLMAAKRLTMYDHHSARYSTASA
jgi:hypothetical protein